MEEKEVRLFSPWPHSAKSPGLIALIGGVVVIAGALQTNAGHAILHAAGLYHQEPPGYTSLSFKNPRALPEQLQPKHTKIAASFMIQNATNSAQDYTWTISLVRQGRTDRLYTGSTSLTPGSEAEINRALMIACTSGQIRMVASLEHPAESISALMTCRS
jgi:hypothetical protein